MMPWSPAPWSPLWLVASVTPCEISFDCLVMSEMIFSVVSQNGSDGIRVADLLDRLADDLLVVELGVGRDLAGEDHRVALDQRLARHAALRILLEAGVEHGVGDVSRRPCRDDLRTPILT